MQVSFLIATNAKVYDIVTYSFFFKTFDIYAGHRLYNLKSEIVGDTTITVLASYQHSSLQVCIFYTISICEKFCKVIPCQKCIR